MSRFREWWKYIRFDQGWIWTIGCFLGMGLPALLTVDSPAGHEIGGMAVAVPASGGHRQRVRWAGEHGRILPVVRHTTHGLLDSLQHAARHHGSAAENRDRHPVDQQSRRSTMGERRRTQGVLQHPGVFIFWGCIAINLAQPFILILLGAFTAGLMMAIYGVQVWYVNRKFLPPEVQAPVWRQACLLLFSAFFAFFTIVVILQRVFNVRI